MATEVRTTREVTLPPELVRRIVAFMPVDRGHVGKIIPALWCRATLWIMKCPVGTCAGRAVGQDSEFIWQKTPQFPGLPPAARRST